MAMEYLQQEQHRSAVSARGGLRLVGLVTVAAGAGARMLLRALIPSEPLYLAATIPLLVGVVLFLYGQFFVRPKE